MKRMCKKVQNRFVSFFSDELNKEQRLALQSHLKDCAICREKFEQFGGAWNALGEALSEPPPAQMEDRFDIMLRAYKRGMMERNAKAETLAGLTESLKLLFWQPVWKFALPLLLVGVGFLLGSFASTQRHQSHLGAISAEMDDMRQLVMLSLLKQSSSVERLQAVNWSYKVQQPRERIRDALRRALTQDPNVNVRLAALRALQAYADDSLVRQDIINSFSHQSSPLVQTAIIDFILRYEKRPAEMLKILAQEENLNQAVKQHLHWNIGFLQGETYYKENENENDKNVDHFMRLPGGRKSESN